MNRVVLMGRLAKDPDLRQTNSGASVCTFTLAVQRRYADQSGQRQADFIPVVCWRGLAENVDKYLQKGSKAGVSGSMQTRNYEANDGSKRYITEVVADEVEFLDRAGEKKEEAPVYDGGFGQEIDGDELPF